MIGPKNDLAEVMRTMRRALKDAENGKVLQRQLSKRLRKFMQPLVAQQKSRIMAIPSKGHSGESLRQAVARQTRAATRWSGKSAGIQIIQRARGMPREFNMAGRMFNREGGWDPQSLGGETFHQEARPAGWFDDPVQGSRHEMTQQVIAAIEETSDKIARSAH